VSSCRAKEVENLVHRLGERVSSLRKLGGLLCLLDEGLQRGQTETRSASDAQKSFEEGRTLDDACKASLNSSRSASSFSRASASFAFCAPRLALPPAGGFIEGSEGLSFGPDEVDRRFGYVWMRCQSDLSA
jgi:hypothetical protein